MISAESDILPRLGAYIEAANDELTVWGTSDCTAWSRRWVESIHGKKIPLPRWRSREEAMVLIAEAGSLAELWADRLDRYGMNERFGDPEPGDVGVIKAHLFPQIGGIFLQHGLFAWRAEPAGTRVLLPKSKTIVKAWALL